MAKQKEQEDAFHDPPKSHPLEDTGSLVLGARAARYDHAMRQIARAANISFVADYFTKPTSMKLPDRAENLQAVMRLAKKSLNVTHRWRGNVMVVRSRDWFAAVDKEPQSEVVDRWEEASKGRSKLDLMDYLFAARKLSDAQIATFVNHMNEEGVRLWEDEVKLLMRNRHVLRGYASLSGMQRAETRSKVGLPVSKLSKAQAAVWKPALRILGLFPRDALAQLRIKTVPSQPLPKFTVVGAPQLGEISLVAFGG